MSSSEQHSGLSSELGTNRLAVGTTIGKYGLLRKLGQGGIARVFLVEHIKLGTLHALKVVRGTSKTAQAYLEAEGRAMAVLAHPNIVAVTDVVDFEDGYGLIMQYVPGPNLSQFLKLHSLSLPVALGMIATIAHAVRHAHRRGFVHRDLTAANILMEDDADGWQLRVTDFGLVKILGDLNRPLDPAAKDIPGLAIGTPQYMAPEQVLDSSTVDERADLWALGILLYQLTTRKMPFNGENPERVFDAIMAGDYRPASEVNPALPPEVDQLVGRLLEPNAAERVQSCDRLLELLDESGLEYSISDDGFGDVIPPTQAAPASTPLWLLVLIVMVATMVGVFGVAMVL